MRRRILIVLLSFGVVAGFGSGIARLVHHRHHGGRWGQERWAAVCAEAALEATGKPASGGKD